MTETTKRRAAWWWIDRWRKSTAYTDMTLAEQGAYRNLLDELWLRGGLLPDDERILARASGDALEWPKVRMRVMARFERTPHGWRNVTHDEVAASTETALDRQREKGAKRAATASRGPAGRYQPDQPDHQPHDQPDHQPPASRTTSHETSLPDPDPYSVLRTPDPEQVGRNTPPPALPPADQAERAIRQSTDALRTRLYGLVGEMAREDPEQADLTELMRMVTAYDKPDGTRVKGVVNAALLTYERLEHSIADAEAMLAEWRAADGAATTRSA